MTLYEVLPTLLRTNVVSLWRRFVVTERVFLLGLKNRHGHWMPTGKITWQCEEHAQDCFATPDRNEQQLTVTEIMDFFQA